MLRPTIRRYTIISLNEISCKVLLEIGLSPGINAFALAGKLERDQSGINRVCKKLRDDGFVVAVEGENVKNAPVLKLHLALPGLAYVIVMMTYRDIRNREKIHGGVKQFDLLLENNRHLHETIGIFMECISFAGEKGTRDAVHMLFESFVCRLGRYLEDYSEAISLTKPTKTRGKCFEMEKFRESDWESVYRTGLYADLFFDFAHIFTPYEENGRVYGDKLIQLFKESEGWPSILRAIEQREADHARLMDLKERI